MPVDASGSRRAGRTSSDADSLGMRRARGEISCAECRRLKLKCDKKVPCGSCTRRGCAPICPNGSLATGQGARSHLADTAQLHAKIAEMGHRIGQLEEALATLQSGVSNEPHPLLQEELLAIKSPFGQNNITVKKDTQENTTPMERTTAAFGTLSIDDRGEGRYFGPSAGSEALFLAGGNLEETSDPEEDYPTEITIEIARILTNEGNVDGAMNVFFQNLPEQPRAWALCETYLEQAAWVAKPIKRDEIIEDLLSPTYKFVRESTDLSAVHFSPHKLSALYMIFALGALVDLTLEPCSKDAEHYYHLSRACLSLRSVFDSPEIATVQALTLMASYHGWAGRRYTVDSSWGLISLASKTAQSLGLHRDPGRFNLDQKTVERRRGLFWETFTLDVLYSLALGRPPSIRPSYIDCQFPAEEEQLPIGEDGKHKIGYVQCKYELARDIMSSILEQTVTAAPPKYETILALDSKIRQKKIPEHLNAFPLSNTEDNVPTTPSTYMRHSLLGHVRAVGTLYIHRNFFAQAILDHPENPLRSPYAPSFLATYRCASGIIKSAMNHFERFPQLCRRWWGVWTQLFSAAMIVGCIVTRSPGCSLAASAYIELGAACDLFEKHSNQSKRSRSGSAILYKVRRRASEVYSRYISGEAPTIGGILSTGKPDYGEDELALFGGQTKVLVTKLLSQYPRRKTPTRSQSIQSLTSSRSSPGSSGNVDAGTFQPMDVHPHLVEYLSMYPPSNHPSPEGHGPTQREPSVVLSQPNQTHEKSLSHDYNPPAALNATFDWWNHNQQPTLTQSPPGMLPLLPPNNDMNQQPQPQYDFTCGYPKPENGVEAQSRTNFDQQFVQDNASQLVDMGMMLSGDVGMDEQWLSFMRESGFLDNDILHPQPQPAARQPMFMPGDTVGIL